MPNLAGKGAGHQIKAVGGPRFGFLCGAGVRDEQQTLQFQHGLLEALVAGWRFEFRGLPKFERRQGPVLFERLPKFQRIVRNAPHFVAGFGPHCRSLDG